MESGLVKVLGIKMTRCEWAVGHEWDASGMGVGSNLRSLPPSNYQKPSYL